MDDFRTALIEALRHLASDPDDQIAYLIQIGGVHVDELALQFHDVAVLADAKLRQGEIDTPQYDGIMALDTALDDMSGEENAALWTEDALRASDAWVEIRGLARGCLRSLGADPV